MKHSINAYDKSICVNQCSSVCICVPCGKPLRVYDFNPNIKLLGLISI